MRWMEPSILTRTNSTVNAVPCRTHKNGTITYFHSAILPVIVAPGQSQVISLAPEFITPQDGHQKQDCEVAAAKRWLETHAPEFQGQAITLLGDDLYSHQPMCQQVIGGNELYLYLSRNVSYCCLRLVEIPGWYRRGKKTGNKTVASKL